MTIRGRLSAAFWLGMVAWGLPTAAMASPPVPMGGDEGELDVNARFTGAFGQVEPTERPTTFQSADIRTMSGGLGYTLGELGPFEDVYLRVGGSYFTAAAEAVEDGADDLPVGYQFYEQDRGGTITAQVSVNLVHDRDFTFGLFVQGTVPLGVDFAKFSNAHIHYVGGGTHVSVFLTNPDKLFRLSYTSQIFIGSGAYEDDAQHNATIALTNLFALEAAWWALPWRMGVSFGPYIEGDMNEHVNTAYQVGYGSVTPDLVTGDRVRAMSLAFAVLPFFHVTDHAVVEGGFVQELFGYDAAATQIWTGGVRAMF
jgi:hypothetical protein